MKSTRFFILMGVAGSGKTFIGKALADHLGWDFYDADDFHPPANIAKMAGGTPLDDDDRAPWLDSLHQLISTCLQENRPGVLACSALKERYRQVLLANNTNVQIIYLKGSYELIQSRLSARTEHFMKPQMLQSQFAALEAPAYALTVDVSLSADEITERIMNTMSKPAQIAILGLGVMGRSLALNLHRNGVNVIGYDPTPKVPENFPVKIFDSVAELVSTLESPRIFLLMVPAGDPVDKAINSLKPHLQEGDIIMDGGNSFFVDTERRVKTLRADGIYFVGMGISGGESGALWGASIMPGGEESAWVKIQPMLKLIAAKAPDGTPCVSWMGSGGAGHYVKMVHNGIEYGDMQLIAEMYDLLHRGAGMSNTDLAAIFAKWNQGELKSYLIEITANILQRKEDGQDLVNLILDEAAQKGTGKWTSQNAFDVGAPIPTINAAVESRILSSMKKERVEAARLLGGTHKFVGDKQRLVNLAEQALYASKVTSYAQGFAMLRLASAEHDWELDLANIARVWRAGCIIRAGLLEDVSAAFERNPHLPNLLLDSTFSSMILKSQAAWREVVQIAVGLGTPMLATSVSLAYFDAYRSATLPANLTQAQRDYFGAHTYRRMDRDGTFHTEWERG